MLGFCDTSSLPLGHSLKSAWHGKHAESPHAHALQPPLTAMHWMLESHTHSTAALPQTGMGIRVTPGTRYNAGQAGVAGSLKFRFSNKCLGIPGCWSWSSPGRENQWSQALWHIHTSEPFLTCRHDSFFLFPLGNSFPSCNAWVKHQLLCEAAVRCASPGTAAPVPGSVVVSWIPH